MALTKLRLATIHVQRGQIDEAVSTGTEALALSSRLRSARSRSYVRDLERRLAPHLAVPRVRELQERIRSTPSVAEQIGTRGE